MDMNTLDFVQFLTPAFAASLLRAAMIVIVGLPALYILSKWIKRLTIKKYTAHIAMLMSRVVFYLGVIILAVSVMNELGFSLAPLLGAAGILGIALGFASQTSVSNIISGLFLLTEEPFRLGDVISVGNLTGEVFALDLLSVKIRLFDNRYARIPNESIAKSEIINLTRFPIRRLDVNVSVAYKENIERVRGALREVARKNPFALQEPEPVIIFSGFGSSSIDLMFGVWVERANYLRLKNSLQEEIKVLFDREGIEIPFPHLSLYAGAATEPFPVEVVKTTDPSQIKSGGPESARADSA